MKKRVEAKRALLTTLLKEYSVKEINSIFANIDEKIMSLHECSSQDFLTFNTQMKKYYKDAKIISDNANGLFEIITGKESRAIFNEFNAFHERLKAHVGFFQKELNLSISTLTKILNNLNFIYIPLKNFGQNLMTLKYLLTNLKFNASYSDFDKNINLEQQIEIIVDLIDKIRINSPIVDGEIFQLKSIINNTVNKLEKINLESTSNVELLLTQIHSNISFLSSKHEEALVQIPKLRQITEHCFNSISKIVTSLQYQDIIRQKMQNIQDTYKEIIKELNLLDSKEADKIVLFKQAKYASQIPYIAELQIAQLIQTNKEFQNAIQVITNQFIEISEYMTSIADMCQKISSHTHKSGETHFKEIKDKLENAENLIQSFINANFEFNTEIKSILEVIDKISTNFNSIVDLDSRLQELAFSSLSFPGAPDLSKISQQIKVLASELRINLNKSQYLFEQTIILSKELHSYLTFEGNEDDNSLNLSKKVHSILNYIDLENEKILNILNQNRDLGETISSQIKTSHEEVRYYDFFEKIIEEIIIELNSIYRRLETEHTNIIEAAKANDLKSIEKLYTTKSERLVHEELTNSDIEFEKEKQKEEEKENNIEFF